jgi:probable rRNA maturation factor
MVDIFLLIEDKKWNEQKYINFSLAKKVFVLVLKYLKISIKKNNIVEFSIILSNNKNIKKINKKYRNKDNSTNVLTFSLYGDIKNIINDFKKKPYLSLGDMIFSYEMIESESKEQNKTFEEHFIHLLVHSYLHLFSYDHIKKEEETIMENIEIKILKILKIKNPYE